MLLVEALTPKVKGHDQGRPSGAFKTNTSGVLSQANPTNTASSALLLLDLGKANIKGWFSAQSLVASREKRNEGAYLTLTERQLFYMETR